MSSERSPQLDFIENLSDRSRSGRSIVPLLGAGISIEAGIPSLAELTRYLTKVQYYIRNQVYDPGPRRPDALKPPSEYIRDFGWPEPKQLHSDLWHWLENCSKSGVSPRGAALGDERRLWMDQMFQSEILKHLEHLDEQLADGLAALHGHIRKRPYKSENLPLMLKSAQWRLRGNYWKGLLSHLTRSNPDYVDTLFQQLVRNRSPATAHRYLAFLVPVLRLRVFLTTNFDTLLEDALRMEELEPVVYEAVKGSPLPHPSLVHENISVIKLHGGAFGLAVGDELDSPLDRESGGRLHDYLPPEPVLLVLGLGGWDLRVLDLVELVLGKAGEVFWVHFEQQSQWRAPVKQRFGSNSKFYPCRFLDPGAFLKELFGRMTNSHPASNFTYRAYDQRPIPSRFRNDGPPGETVFVFTDDEDDGHVQSASRRLSEFVAAKAGIYSPIWIDLESKFRVDDVIVDIFHQLQRYDPALPNEILPAILSVMPDDVADAGHTENGASYAEAVKRLLAAMRRGRYVLAFDGVGSFGRPPTQHHGQPVGLEVAEAERSNRLQAEFFWRFIDAASSPSGPAGSPGEHLRDSLVGFSVDLRCRRTAEGDIYETPSFWRHYVEGRPELPRELRAGIDAGEVADFVRHLEASRREAWVLLCAFRRRRSIVALRRLLPEYLGTAKGETREQRADSFLRTYENQDLLRVEGGYYWLKRQFRNQLYLHLLGGSRTAILRADLERWQQEGAVPADWAERLRNLRLSINVHHDIAAYYRELYIASREVPALLEHVYHRISALRYATKLAAWAPVLRTVEPSAVNELDVWPQLAQVLDIIAETPEAAADIGSRPASSGPPYRHGRLLRLVERYRWRSLRSLRGTLWREKERMLAQVPALTLSSWVKWIRDHDLWRLEVATCLFGGAGSTGRELRSSSSVRQPFEDELDALGAVLDDLEAAVYENRLDVDNLRRVRRPWLESGRAVTDLAAAGADRRRAVERKRAEIRFQVSATHRHRGELKAAGEVLRPLRRPGEVKGRHTPVRPFAESDHLQILLRVADVERVLTRARPWRQRVRKRRSKAVVVAVHQCRSALRLLEWIEEPDRTLRSYLHSLHGRAKYLSGDVDSAFREFDLAHAALSGTKGLGALELRAECHAIAHLWQAEALMLHADSRLRSMAKRNWTDGLVAARQRLESAWDLLDAADVRLDRSRRGVQWTYWLLQLRAQLHVERLLLQIGGGLRARIEVAARSDGGWWDSRRDDGRTGLGRNARRLRIGAFVGELRQGLRAVRQGLAVVLPAVPSTQDETRLRSDPRLGDFLRLWVELMICGACLTRLERGGGKPTVGELWAKWDDLNRLEGVERLPECSAYRDWIEGQESAVNGAGPLPTVPASKEERFGRSERVRALRLFDQCLKDVDPVDTLMPLLLSPPS